jgi:hypothetical protein
VVLPVGSSGPGNLTAHTGIFVPEASMARRVSNREFARACNAAQQTYRNRLKRSGIAPGQPSPEEPFEPTAFGDAFSTDFTPDFA